MIEDIGGADIREIDVAGFDAEPRPAVTHFQLRDGPVIRVRICLSSYRTVDVEAANVGRGRKRWCDCSEKKAKSQTPFHFLTPL